MTEQEEKKTQEACAAEKEETPAGECGCDTETCAEEPKEEKKALSVEELQTALQLAEAKVLEHYDLYVRAMAELENTRRRSNEEVQKARKYGIEKFAENLLPVVDSLEKALELTKEDEQNPLREGMAATYRQLTHALEVSGMKEINPKGEVFDPHHHQAIAMVPATEEIKAGCVVEVFQRGWLINERVLRPAMVSVAQG